MKIKEAIIKSVNQQFENEDTQEKVSMPFVFTSFTQELAAVYTAVATAMLAKDMPEAFFNGVKSGGKGIAPKKVKASDIINVLNGNDLLRHTTLFQQSMDFMTWFFEQDVPEDLYDEQGSPMLWYAAEHIGEMWNKYAMMTMAENLERQ